MQENSEKMIENSLKMLKKRDLHRKNTGSLYCSGNNQYKMLAKITPK
jgi:hypothetical protein